MSTRLVASLAQPLLYLVIFGTGLSSALSGAGGAGGFGGRGAPSELTYQQFIFPGIMGMAVLFSAIFGAMSIPLIFALGLLSFLFFYGKSWRLSPFVSI